MVPAGKTAAMQRDLQRIYLGYLARMVVDHASTAGAPPEARALARLNLTRIGAGIDRAYQRSGLSDEANAHLIEARARIDRTLDAEMESSF